MFDLAICYDAMLRRDPASDGRFFVAVLTTKIYCRPVCTAKLPLARNVRIFPTAAAAEHGGFRPCLRCRPETAPFCPAWKGTKSTVERALRLIESGALDGADAETFAARVGIGARHLARLFAKHLGASPTEIARTLRVQRAKRLLDETDLSMADVASHSGFVSPRRMSAAFTALYGRSPSRLRASAARRSEVRPQAPACS